MNKGFGMMTIDGFGEHSVEFADGNLKRFYVKCADGGWMQIEALSKKAAIKKAEKKYGFIFEKAVTYNEYHKTSKHLEK